jgi:hypothetical protein
VRPRPGVTVAAWASAAIALASTGTAWAEDLAPIVTASVGLAATSTGAWDLHPEGAFPARRDGARAAAGVEPTPVTTRRDDAVRSGRRPDPLLDQPFGWPAGTVQQQLDRDTTLVPYGKGSLFVPAITNGFDEPPVSVWLGDRRVAEGKTGTRVVLHPGTYEVKLGSGPSEGERMSAQVAVREAQTAIVPPSWAAMQVHVIDEQYGSVRASYEIIRMDDRAYVGLGFGTDEQAGEPVSTWILRPGLYKIIRVGETYRARRDFFTVRVEGGKLTHFNLVVSRDTGDFVGGGEVPETELFRPRGDFYGSLVVGGDVSFGQRSNVLGLPDGVSYSLRAFADGRLKFTLFGSPLVFLLQLEQGQTKAPNLPFQKTNDRLKLDGLYVLQLEPWIGPYARVGAETNLVPGDLAFADPTDVALFDVDGARRDRAQVTELRLSPSFGLSQLKEGVGIHIRVFKSIFGEATARTGFGARHRLARDLFEPRDDLGTPTVQEFYQVGSTNQIGVEATVLGAARITRWVLLNLELDTLVPFEGVAKTILELEASVALKLTNFISINYVARIRRDPFLLTETTVQQDVRLRFSLELL